MLVAMKMGAKENPIDESPLAGNESFLNRALTF
jgi:hypothetical protein